MSFKTVSIVVISVLVTVVLMNNTDEIDFWLFGNARIPKLAILGAMFAAGLIVGYMLGRPRKKVLIDDRDEPIPATGQAYTNRESIDQLSDEDRDYIK